MIQIDGQNKRIILSVATAFDRKDIHDTAIDWSTTSDNMQYSCPVIGGGKFPLGGGSYSDIFTNLNTGWRFQASGYTAGTVISINGSLLPAEGEAITVSPLSGGVPQFIFNRASYGIVVEVNTSGGTGSAPTAQQNAEAVYSALEPKLSNIESVATSAAKNAKSASQLIATLD